MRSRTCSQVSPRASEAPGAGNAPPGAGVPAPGSRMGAADRVGYARVPGACLTTDPSTVGGSGTVLGNDRCSADCCGMHDMADAMIAMVAHAMRSGYMKVDAFDTFRPS